MDNVDLVLETIKVGIIITISLILIKAILQLNIIELIGGTLIILNFLVIILIYLVIEENE